MSINRYLALGGVSAVLLVGTVSYLAYSAKDARSLLSDHFDKGIFGLGYKRDLRTICDAEAGSQVTLQKNAAKVAEWMGAHIETPAAHALVAGLPRDLAERSKRLRAEATLAGIGVCPLADGYLTLRAAGELRGDVSVICEEGAFPQIPFQEPDDRVATLKKWAVLHSKTDEMRKAIDDLATVPVGARGARLKSLADAHNVFRCDVARMLDEPKLPPRPAGVVLSGPPQVTGPGVTPESFERAFDLMKPELSTCYEQALKKASDLAGSLSLKVSLGKEQDANRVFSMGGTMTETATVECVSTAFRRVRLPGKHDDGTVVFFGLEFIPPSPL